MADKLPNPGFPDLGIASSRHKVSEPRKRRSWKDVSHSNLCKWVLTDKLPNPVYSYEVIAMRRNKVSEL